jgi:hypothetical protein
MLSAFYVLAMGEKGRKTRRPVLDFYDFTSYVESDMYLEFLKEIVSCAFYVPVGGLIEMHFITARLRLKAHFYK